MARTWGSLTSRTRMCRSSSTARTTTTRFRTSTSRCRLPTTSCAPWTMTRSGRSTTRATQAKGPVNEAAGTVRARDLWREICESAWEDGRPRRRLHGPRLGYAAEPADGRHSDEQPVRRGVPRELRQLLPGLHKSRQACGSARLRLRKPRRHGAHGGAFPRRCESR